MGEFGIIRIVYFVNSRLCLKKKHLPVQMCMLPKLINDVLYQAHSLKIDCAFSRGDIKVGERGEDWNGTKIIQMRQFFTENYWNEYNP